MDRHQRINGFDFDDDRVCDDQIEAITDIQLGVS
jgi:hypothetical protein